MLRRISHPALTVLAAGLIGPLVYIRLVMPGHVAAGFDLVSYFYPYRHYLAEAWAQGRWLPLWNSDIFMGAPFLANIQAAALYPLSLIFALLPTESALGWSILIHLAIAGSGMFLYARRAEVMGTAGAMVTSAAYTLSGYMNAHLGHLNQSNTLAWTPWLMLSVDLLARRPRAWRVAVSGTVVALIILAGHTQQAYFSFLMAGWAGLTRLLPLALKGSWRSALSRGALALSAAALGLLIAAAQVIPTLELVGQSIRNGGLSLDEAGQFSLALRGSFGYLLPDYVSAQGSEYQAYEGMVVIALAALGIARYWRRPRMLSLALLIPISIWAAYGPHYELFSLLFRLVPGIDLFRVPARLLFFATVAASILAGHGVRSAWQLALAWHRGHRWRPISAGILGWAALVPGGALLALLADRVTGFPNHYPLRLLPQYLAAQDLGEMAIFVAAIAVLVLLPLTRPRTARYAIALTPALLVVEMALASGNTEMQHPLPPSIYHEQDGILALLPKDPNARYISLARPSTPGSLADGVPADVPTADRDRYLGLADNIRGLRADVGMGSGRLTADGYDGGILPVGAYITYRQPLLAAGSANPPDFTLYLAAANVGSVDWLRASGVALVLGRDGDAVGPAPCLTVAGCGLDPEPLAPGIVAWRVEGPPVARAYVVTDSGESVPAWIVSDTGEQVRIELPPSPGGKLVLADTFYPGWEAKVDGHATTISRYDGLLRSVPISAGTTEVVFSYQPRSVTEGLVLSAVGLLLALGLLLSPLLSRRHRVG